jgi:hypothetical protein
VRYVTGPSLAGETGGGVGLRPKSGTWKVPASTTMDRYLPVGRAAPGGGLDPYAMKMPPTPISSWTVTAPCRLRATRLT